MAEEGKSIVKRDAPGIPIFGIPILDSDQVIRISSTGEIDMSAQKREARGGETVPAPFRPA
ncbi:MAG TPA: hypothetical protein VEC01_01270 [Noviherbaspirillum sp.]|uniref:hypothetical protein n=1 Tax=Noviherbaspirillum sp. TaxID=1926288 RepID=UPI002D710EEC|nr:hypothetical protein [Noviherbaspirillum sp.]HYD93925.1 hypothetical protein [Noviherbaspirillum sp.]